MNSHAIGGYLGLEVTDGAEFYESQWALNSGRAAFELALIFLEATKVHVPYYTCHDLFEPIKRLGIDIQYYHINENLELLSSVPDVGPYEYLVYTNYFGLKTSYTKLLAEQLNGHLIVDNSQAFFERPLKGLPTFYSCRKFFGVPDGGYLSLELPKSYYDGLTQSTSYQRMSHLLKRVDKSPESGYEEFKENDASLIGERPMRMSNLTKHMLKGVDYHSVSKRRLSNFEYLHDQLKRRNKFSINHLPAEGPLVYPFWSNNLNLRLRLIKNRIFVPTYWPGVVEIVPEESLEHQLVNQLLALPIDQRYGVKDMDQVLRIIEDSDEE